MKLVRDTKLKKHSVWLDDTNYSRDHASVYGIEGDLNFKLLLKLKTILGTLYIQHDTDRWSIRLENYTELYKRFVDKKK